MNSIRLTTKEIKALIKDITETLETTTCFESPDFYKKSKPEKQKRPCVSIPYTVWAKIQTIVAKCDKEVAWHCTVERSSRLGFTLTDVLIPPQIVTSTSVDVDATKYADWIASLSDEQLNTMRCHCHSHVNMGVFSSSTDNDYQREQTEANVTDYYIFLIFNKKHDVFCRIVDVEHNVFYDNADIDVLVADCNQTELDLELKQKVVTEGPIAKVKAKAFDYNAYKLAEIENNTMKDWWSE